MLAYFHLVSTNFPPVLVACNSAGNSTEFLQQLHFFNVSAPNLLLEF